MTPYEKNEVRAWLLPLMRDMWQRLEKIGVVALIGPAETIVPLRQPTMTEFRAAAEAAGVPQPRSWPEFFCITFGPDERGNDDARTQ